LIKPFLSIVRDLRKRYILCTFLLFKKQQSNKTMQYAVHCLPDKSRGGLYTRIWVGVPVRKILGSSYSYKFQILNWDSNPDTPKSINLLILSLDLLCLS